MDPTTKLLKKLLSYKQGNKYVEPLLKILSKRRLNTNLWCHPECSSLAWFNIIQFNCLKNSYSKISEWNIYFMQLTVVQIPWLKSKKKVKESRKVTFANPKSATLTDPFASTNIFAHLISLQVVGKIVRWYLQKFLLAQNNWYRKQIC
jgi:hypothetical protein